MAGATVSTSGTAVPAQVERRNGKLAVAWVVHDLRRGAKRTYTVTFVKSPKPAADQVRVVMKPAVNGVQSADIRLASGLFATYDAVTGPNKPYFHPVYAPGQKQVVRGYPVAPRPGETTDHIHHRGLWFTHGAVNGEDYWAETQSRTVHRGYRDIVSGPVYGGFTALTDWVNKAGVTVARDMREVRVYELAGARVMDVSIAMQAVGGPLTFGDTKEGSFGLRLADSMRLKGGDGQIVNSEGITGGDTWGKRAAWVDYSGTVEGAKVGVAIFDHPTSFRHPTHWHVRDYGLFCANPFGIHDFERGQPATAGAHTVPSGGQVKFRYRCVFHAGNAQDARIAARWNDYADPPKVRVLK
jgi:hypothetical protein